MGSAKLAQMEPDPVVRTPILRRLAPFSGKESSCLLHIHRSFVELVRLGGKPVSQMAGDLGISYSCLRNWVRQADIDEGTKQGLTGDERAELVRLRRENRIQAMEIEILKRASALFARDHVLPK
jgi:transposase